MYLVSHLGHDVLFQDADVVWLRNPVEYFRNPTLSEFDAFFMDDGARSKRFAPFFANSGFYFLRANHKTRHFMHSLLLSFDEIMAVRSHQHVLDRLLGQHAAAHALRVQVLAKEAFPQGQVFHHNKALMKSIVDFTTRPFVFHMCWTANKKDKLKYMQQTGIWFLANTCTEETIRAEGQPDAKSFARCCDPAVETWRPGGKYPSIKS